MWATVQHLCRVYLCFSKITPSSEILNCFLQANQKHHPAIFWSVFSVQFWLLFGLCFLFLRKVSQIVQYFFNELWQYSTIPNWQIHTLLKMCFYIQKTSVQLIRRFQGVIHAFHRLPNLLVVCTHHAYNFFFFFNSTVEPLQCHLILVWCRPGKSGNFTTFTKLESNLLGMKLCNI